MEAFGINITDQMYDQMEQGIKRAAITGPIFQAIFLPIVIAIEAGILVVIFSLLMGGAATFKHVYAVVTHSTVIVALQQVFSMALSYASGKAAGRQSRHLRADARGEQASSRSFSAPSICFWSGRRSVWRSASACCTSAARARSPRRCSGLYVVFALVIAFFRSGS